MDRKNTESFLACLSLICCKTPPSKPRGELKRFTAKCTIKVIGELDAVKLRWSPDGAWEPANPSRE